MRLLGLTGGIATGKSTVARMLAQRGAAVIDSDVLAREVVEPGQPALAEIAERFGPGVLDADGRLDRPALAAIVFADSERRRELEAITHPRIRRLTEERVLALLATDVPLVVLDIPLLFENGLERTVEGTLLVDAAPEVQLDRLVRRDGLSADDARRRMAAQMPLDEKRRRATWVIDNSGTPAQTEARVASWWDEVVARRRPNE